MDSQSDTMTLPLLRWHLCLDACSSTTPVTQLQSWCRQRRIWYRRLDSLVEVEAVPSPLTPCTLSMPLYETADLNRTMPIRLAGGLYVAFNGRERHTVTVRRVQFVRNYAPTAGGLEIGFVSGGHLGADTRLLAYDSEFIENDANFGGGVFFFTLSMLSHDHSQLCSVTHLVVMFIVLRLLIRH